MKKLIIVLSCSLLISFIALKAYTNSFNPLKMSYNLINSSVLASNPDDDPDCPNCPRGSIILASNPDDDPDCPNCPRGSIILASDPDDDPDCPNCPHG